MNKRGLVAVCAPRLGGRVAAEAAVAERLVSTLNVLSIAVGKMADATDSHSQCEGFHQ